MRRLILTTILLAGAFSCGKNQRSPGSPSPVVVAPTAPPYVAAVVAAAETNKAEWLAKLGPGETCKSAKGELDRLTALRQTRWAALSPQEQVRRLQIVAAQYDSSPSANERTPEWQAGHATLEMLTAEEQAKFINALMASSACQQADDAARSTNEFIKAEQTYLKVMATKAARR